MSLVISDHAPHLTKLHHPILPSPCTPSYEAPPCPSDDFLVDSLLFENALESNASPPPPTQLQKDSKSYKVTEMLNGCLCCVLVGQMKNALLEMKSNGDPDRIIIETSGSAFPAPIAWQIRELDPTLFHLDSIITVVDCVNFKGYQGLCCRDESVMMF